MLDKEFIVILKNKLSEWSKSWFNKGLSIILLICFVYITLCLGCDILGYEKSPDSYGALTLVVVLDILILIRQLVDVVIEACNEYIDSK